MLQSIISIALSVLGNIIINFFEQSPATYLMIFKKEKNLKYYKQPTESLVWVKLVGSQEERSCPSEIWIGFKVNR